MRKLLVIFALIMLIACSNGLKWSQIQNGAVIQDIPMGGYKVENMGNGTAPQDAVTKSMEDAREIGTNTIDVVISWDKHDTFTAYNESGYAIASVTAYGYITDLLQAAQDYIDDRTAGSLLYYPGRGRITLRYMPLVYVDKTVYFTPGTSLDLGSTIVRTSECNANVFQWGRPDTEYNYMQTTEINGGVMWGEDTNLNSTQIAVYNTVCGINIYDVICQGTGTFINLSGKCYMSRIDHVVGSHMSVIGVHLSQCAAMSDVVGPSGTTITNSDLTLSPGKGTAIVIDTGSVKVSNCYSENGNFGINITAYTSQVVENCYINAAIAGITLSGTTYADTGLPQGQKISHNTIDGTLSDAGISIRTYHSTYALDIDYNTIMAQAGQKCIYLHSDSWMVVGDVSHNTGMMDGTTSRFYYDDGQTYYSVFEGNKIIDPSTSTGGQGIAFNSTSVGYGNLYNSNTVYGLSHTIYSPLMTASRKSGNMETSVANADVVGSGWI